MFMKKIVFLMLAGWSVLLLAGCGKKGDPVAPKIPYPLPAQNVAASTTEEGILVTWVPPAAYDTGKLLNLEKDIKKIIISRERESSADTVWDFSWTKEGWSTPSETLPIKWYKSMLRTASKKEHLFLLSPKDLSVQANEYRYVRLKFWARNSEQAYFAFITEDDAKWDTDLNLKFQPAVHTSSYSYSRIFAPLKLKAFPLAPTQEDTQAARTYEYVLDMQKLPAWKGTIQQIGIFLQNSDPQHALVEIGLDRCELTNTVDGKIPIYEASPWLFLEDEEGWMASQPTMLFGAVNGVLYAQGDTPILLMSAKGQNIQRKSIRHIRLRMKVTAGDTAYLVWGSQGDELLQELSHRGFVEPSPSVFQVPLNDPSDFHTYTITLKDNDSEDQDMEHSGVSEIISQIGLFFPSLQASMTRHILIDYVAVFQTDVASGLLSPVLIQKDFPSIPDIVEQVHQRRAMNDPDFDISYDDLPSQPEQTSAQVATLVEVSPQQPDPVIIRDDGTLAFLDTGLFKAAPLNYGERYTYTIKLIDRKGRENTQTAQVTVEYARVPRAPYHLRAEAGDGEVQLAWIRPFLTQDGTKIQSLTGYDIFRTSKSGQYPATPIYRASSMETTYVDRDVSNGTTYYYVIQPVAPVTSGNSVGEISQEVSATPVDALAPEAPFGLTGVYIGKTVKLYWNLMQTDDLGGFHVYRSEAPDGTFHRINARQIQQASYNDSNVEPNTTYYYYVVAVDDAVSPNESQPSDVISVRTQSIE